MGVFTATKSVDESAAHTRDCRLSGKLNAVVSKGNIIEVTPAIVKIIVAGRW
jgi:hypothetical protein